MVWRLSCNSVRVRVGFRPLNLDIMRQSLQQKATRANAFIADRVTFKR